MNNNNLFPDYSDEDLRRYVFDGFEGLYTEVESMIDDKGYIGIRDYRYIHEQLMGTSPWEQHILGIRDNPSYKMTWHINEKKKDGRFFSQKAKLLCNSILIEETMRYKYVIGSSVEDEIKGKVDGIIEKSNCPDELVREVKDTFYIQEYWLKRDNELRLLYWQPYSVYDLFSLLIETNGMEWLDFVLIDAKMDYIEVSRPWGKNDSGMLAYLDLCAEKIKLMSNKMILQKDKEYDYNEELLRIFHGDYGNMQRFLKNIQGLSGTAIVYRVKTAIELNMIFEEDSQTPIYNALKELGYNVTSVQNWSGAYAGNKKAPLL